MPNILAIFIIVMLIANPVLAQADQLRKNEGAHPETLEQLINGTIDVAPKEDQTIDDDIESSKIRDEALREAALSYGARGGLARRTAEIRTSLIQHEGNLDQIYDFKRLLIPAPSGLMIEPPIISEGQNASIIETGGQLAAVADRIYNINRNARIVSTARNWRAYLEREWGEISTPPSVLLPRTEKEQLAWATNLATGWEEGIAQADEIFQADLSKLIADYTGMIRYRKLLAQGVVSPPFALQIDRGVTGGGSEMRVGDSAVQITGQSELQTGAFEWQPVPR
jgi:defect-in-organelle-trafficking protein DotC